MSRYTIPTLAAIVSLGLPAIVGAAPSPPVADHPSGTLSVTFIHPETFTDAAWSQSYGSDRQVLDDISQHLARLAARNLPEGYALSIEVLDIDLAGYVDWRYSSQVRVIRDAAWPRMSLRYVLKHGEEVVASGQERLANMNFTWGVNLYGYADRLRYEKAMLDEWFERRITKVTGHA
ncbi:DUF3016 domain-containing protein [Cupriavidus sp. RAF12]|uniref:DUF3016 domain-containing protein n=1 Tax=Cupriavidus sp. RAF12 TaxID=3233050 RepID=UPI003F8EC662